MGIGMLKSTYCKKQHQDKRMFFLVHRIMKCSLTSSSHLSLKFKIRWNTNRFWIIFSKWYPNYPSDNNIAVKLRSPKHCKAQHAIMNLFLITSIKKIVNDFSSSLQSGAEFPHSRKSCDLWTLLAPPALDLLTNLENGRNMCFPYCVQCSVQIYKVTFKECNSFRSKTVRKLQVSIWIGFIHARIIPSHLS